MRESLRRHSYAGKLQNAEKQIGCIKLNMQQTETDTKAQVI